VDLSKKRPEETVVVPNSLNSERRKEREIPTNQFFSFIIARSIINTGHAGRGSPLTWSANAAAILPGSKFRILETG